MPLTPKPPWPATPLKHAESHTQCHKSSLGLSGKGADKWKIINKKDNRLAVMAKIELIEIMF